MMNEKAGIPAFLFALMKIGCYNVSELNKESGVRKLTKQVGSDEKGNRCKSCTNSSP